MVGMPISTQSMLLDTIKVGPNTYMGVSRDEAMGPWLPPRVLLERFSTRLCEASRFGHREGMDEIMMRLRHHKP